MKIRIFTLAKELQMDSKVLIGYCQKIGIHLKDSPLASISEEEKVRVLEFMRTQGAAGTEAPRPAPAPPARDTPRVVTTKVPSLRPSPTRTASGREQAPLESAEETPASEREATPAPAPVETATPVETEAPAVAPEPPVAPTRPSAPKVAQPGVPVRPDRTVATGRPPALQRPAKAAPSKPAKRADAAAAPATPPAVEETEAPSTTEPVTTNPVEREPLEVAAESSSAPVGEAVAPPSEDESPQGDKGSEEPSAAEASTAAGDRPPVAPIRREDYIHASGAGRREMVAIGTVSQLGQGTKKAKSRPMPMLPKLAAPPPTPKAGSSASSGPPVQAQKPEMRISRDMLEKTPLHEHIKAHNQEKTKKVDDFGEEGVEGGKKGQGRSARPAAGAVSPLADRKTRAPKRGRAREMDDDASGDRVRHRSRARGRAPQPHLKSSAEISFPITIRSLSEAMGRRANELIGILMKKGQMVTINAYLDEEQALDLAMECGVDLHIAHEKDAEEQLEETAAETGEPSDRYPRPPIVTILGHVDHGKTTLLDKIRSANVAAGEFGGITQHIAAYQVVHNGRKLTFLDTPGHAAFAEMRARGANTTDIAVLVVAANDGVMPQTIEALNHARAAGVPIVVAMNKVDLPDRNEQRVLQDLATQNLLAAEWGGDTEVVRTSGSTGQGIDDLLETLLTVADLGELTGNPARPGQGVCLEAFRDEGRGALAWLIVQDGTLRKGDVILCGPAYGRIRAMYNDHDQEVDEAGPSTPVKVAGLDLVPWAGDKFYVLADVDEARQIAELRRQRGREAQLAQKGRVRTLAEILSQSETGEVQDLPVIIKGDSPGSLEAIKGEILKFQHPEVRVNILHDGVGGVNESDVYLASASGAIIVAFHVVAEERAEALAEREGVEIRQYNIIYEVTDDIKKALEGLLRPEVVQSRTGRAIVLQTFDISRFGRVAGCRVLNGVIERSNMIRIVRDQRILNEYKIASLKRGKDDSREVREGLECGIRLEGFDDVKEGDIFEAIKVEEIKRTL